MALAAVVWMNNFCNFLKRLPIRLQNMVKNRLLIVNVWVGTLQNRLLYWLVVEVTEKEIFVL